MSEDLKKFLIKFRDSNKGTMQIKAKTMKVEGASLTFTGKDAVALAFIIPLEIIEYAALEENLKP